MQRNLHQTVCARLNVTQMLCLNSPEDTFHVPSEAEQKAALWLPHPCLPKEVQVFRFEINDILPLLSPQLPWKTTDAPDVFQAPI
jgi:hypothetical protein